VTENARLLLRGMSEIRNESDVASGIVDPKLKFLGIAFVPWRVSMIFPGTSQPAFA